MGKKRRFIHRARKFAKKYFKVLDGFDGSTDDAEIESYAAFIDTITATDNNNQTVTFTGRVLGKVSVVTNLGIETNIDDAGFVVSPNNAITDNGSGDIDEYTYTSNPTGIANALGIGAPLSVGTHTVVIRPKGSTDTQLDKEISFTIRENKITLGGLATAFTEDGDNIKFDASELTVSGKKAGGNDTAAALGASSNIAIKIEILKGGVAQTLTGAGNSITLAKAGNFTNTSLDDAHILAANVGGVGGTVHTFVVKLTPFDATTDALLTDSAVELTRTVTKD